VSPDSRLPFKILAVILAILFIAPQVAYCDLQDGQNVQDGQNSTALGFVFRLAVAFEPKKQFSASPRLCVRCR